MNDDEVNIQIERVKRFFDKWIEVLGFGHWKWQVDFNRERGHPEDTPSASTTTTMDIDSRWEYKTFYVNVYLPQTEQHNDRELETCIVHELIHAIVAPMQKNKKADKIEEMVVTDLSHAVIWTWEAAQRAAKVTYDEYEG